jgi:hypothetical protein
MAAGGGKRYKDRNFIMKILLVWTNDGSQAFSDWLEDYAIEPIVAAGFFFLVILVWAGFVDPAAVEDVLMMVIWLSPVWLTIYLGQFFWTTWIHYVRFNSWFTLDFVLLEIQLPPEVEKSPAAMELFLTTLHNAGGEPTFIRRAWHGHFRAVWSLEIASLEGRIHYYIHARRVWKNVVEARLYGQYPEAKITEVEDYFAKIPFNLEEYNLWGSEYQKGATNGLPIRTYVDYALDKNPDTPEIQVDPLTNTLELFNAAGPGEYWFMQIIIKAHKKDEWHGLYLTNPAHHPHYQVTARAEINNITRGAIARAQSFVDEDAEKKRVGSRGSTLLTGGEKLRVEAIEHWLTKLVFECGIRVIYMARRDVYQGINGGAGIRFFDAYSYPEFNKIGAAPHGTSYFDYPWQDWNGMRENLERKNMHFRYKHRAYFYVPYEQQPYYFNTEELATLWHFPSSVVQTPGLDRVPSRRFDAPSNLPT